MSPAFDADKVAKHVEPAKHSLCFNGTVVIGLCANNTSVDSTCEVADLDL